MNWTPLLEEISDRLSAEAVPESIQTEEHFERQFIQPIVEECVRSKHHLATHPWTKPEMTRPYPPEHQNKIRIWRECKEWANVTTWGMKHTLDMFIRNETSNECIAVEVKMCKVTAGELPSGEFQRMIGQSVLFLGGESHRAVVSIFGVKGMMSDPPVDRNMTAFLRSVNIWPVVRRVP